jgi:tetratricopeptide (TPR) repeat protein
MAEAAPASAMLYEVAGRMYQLAGMKSDAQRALRRSLELDAHRPTAELALWRAGDRGVREMVDPQDHGVRDYEHVVASGDQSGVAANNLAFAYAMRGERLDRALELSVDAVHRMPSKPEPMDTLGFVFLKMRQYTAAADAFERALQLAPDAPAKRQILLHLASAYAACGEDDKAASAREQAERLRG